MSSFVAASVLTVASRGNLLPSLLDSEGLALLSCLSPVVFSMIGLPGASCLPSS